MLSSLTPSRHLDQERIGIERQHEHVLLIKGLSHAFDEFLDPISMEEKCLPVGAAGE